MSNEQTSNENIKEEENAATPVEEQTPAADTAAENVESSQNAESEASETDAAAEETKEAEEEKAEETAETEEEKVEEPAAEAQTDKIEPAAEKKQKTKVKRQPTGMSRTFKLVYYPVLVLVAVLLLVFSVIDGVFGYSPKAYNDEYYTAVSTHIKELASSSRSKMTSTGTQSARNYITDKLYSGGFVDVSELKSGDEDDDDTVTTITGWAPSYKPTVTVMSSNLTASLQTDAGVEQYLVGAQIHNVIAALPSEKTKAGEKSGAVIITVRYDSRTDTAGAVDNASFVATAMQSLIEYVKAGTKFDNDLVVVFTEECGETYGTDAFMTAFDGLDDVVSRAVCGISLDAYGNRGTLAVTDVSAAGLDYFYAYSGASGNAYNSSAVVKSLPKELIQTGATDAFKNAGLPAMQVALLGGLDAAQSPLDSVANVKTSVIRQQSDFFKSFVDSLTAGEKAFDGATDKELAFFSYFDWGTVGYNSTAAYVIGAILLALVAGAIVAVALKKTFSIGNMLKALLVEILVVGFAALAMYAAYFLVTLMLTGFGAIPIHAITQVRYFNAGIFIAAMLVALASAFGFTTLFKKLFKVTSSDTVRGTALLFGIVGAIMCFAAPAYSYLVCWLGMLLTATLLVTALLNGKLKSAFGFGFDRLFIFVVPVALCLPIVMASLSALTVVLPLYMLPVTMMLFVGMLGVIVPYLDRTAVVFDKIAKKLPARTLRVERTVTEKVEDRAKKGKFTERTVKRVEKEKIPVNYKNYFGISLITVIAVVTALIAGGVGVTFGKSVTDFYSYDAAAYNDAIVYEWNYDSSGTVNQKIVVDDLIAYKYVRYAVPDLSWDSENSRYVKELTSSSYDVVPANSEPKITRSGDSGNYTYSVETFEGSHSYVKITIPSASSITEITVSNSRDISYRYEFNNREKIVLVLPYGFGNFTMKFQGWSPVSMEYEEYCSVTTASTENHLANVDEWNKALQYYRDSDVYGNIRGAIVLKRSVSF